MQEALLQFIWQYSLYRPANMRTTAGELVTVIHPGMRNTHAGPDFLQAKIKVGDTLLVGNVELHLRTSHWLQHGHQHDAAYSKLILHVVYEDDGATIENDAPTLVLKPHIPQSVLQQYATLMQPSPALPCASQLGSVKDIVKESWLNRLLAERWEQKLGEWDELFAASAGDWRSLLYWRMAANFGFKVNATPFLMLAQSLPLNILARHSDNLMQLEALLFGQAAMLQGTFTDAYPRHLQREYQYLRQKYKLEPIDGSLWKFLRMRPANFPTIRIAQFAALVARSVNLFSQIIETQTIKDMSQLLDVQAGSYWDDHYRLDEPSPVHAVKHLGKASIQNIIINTIAPIRFLYAREQGTAAQQQDALQLLETMKPERNNIIALWDSYGWKAVNAAQAQAQIQLHNNYCLPRRCLSCSIGLSLLRTAPAE